MSSLTRDTIAIDANVFRHMFNPQNNVDGHIHALLNQLMDDKIKLLIDDEGEILKECNHQLKPYLKSEDDRYAEGPLLLYWFRQANQKLVPVDSIDDLMTAINPIVPPCKGADRFYVYVALKEGRILVTNDKKDIWNVRDSLLEIEARAEGADILTSQEAHRKL